MFDGLEILESPSLRPRSFNHILMTADTLGGVWSYCTELISQLEHFGVRVSLLRFGRPLSRSQRLDIQGLRNLQVYETDLKLDWTEEPWRDVDRARLRLMDLERELHPDLVHINSLMGAEALSSTPSLAVVHSGVMMWWRAVKGSQALEETSWKRYREEISASLNHATLIVTPSYSLRAALKHEYALETPVRVIPHGRNPEHFRPRHKEPVVFASGRLWDEAKNLRLLAQNAYRIEWPVWIAGESTGPYPYLDFAPSTGKNLKLLGEIASEQMSLCLGRASIYVSPALYEPFGLGILEAALSGCALVLSDIDSMREIWGSSALYFDPRDPEAMVAQVNRLISDPEVQKEMSERSRDRAYHAYSSDRLVEDYLDVYRLLTSPRGRPQSPFCQRPGARV